ncbi:hypothetical protein RRG08_019417 [Elysia crispata]|uniref:Uncharacterized protein n=1 Tax=Elysia crispata TaxID=231223 RepID=A0AAE0Z3C7_9GAST|nr:hypothetical protein RRG08_019417 [Elysia crispata]
MAIDWAVPLGSSVCQACWKSISRRVPHYNDVTRMGGQNYMDLPVWSIRAMMLLDRPVELSESSVALADCTGR